MRLMRRHALLLTILILAAAAPIRMAVAAPSPLPTPSAAAPVKFDILPGPLTVGKPFKRVFSYTLAPGQTMTATLAIVNASRTAAVTIRLHASDAYQQGGGVVFNDSSHQRQIGQWIHLGASTVTVPRYHITYVPLTIELPPSVPTGVYEGALNATDVHPLTVGTGGASFHLLINKRRLVFLRVVGRAPGH